MKLQDYLKSNGVTGRALAAEIGVPAVLISQWATGVRRVPAERCIQIEAATHGAVRCEDMRDDIDWSVLRCQAPTQPPASEAA